MRHFVRQSIKGEKVVPFNQYYESSISEKIFKTISDDLNVEDYKCGVKKKLIY